MRNTSSLFVICLLCGMLWGCSSSEPQYRIGMSQCFDDAWRQKMNDEMDCELLLHPEITMDRCIAYGDNARQCAQIDSFVRAGVNLLIVSPNDPDLLQPAVSRAYQAGIPVIVADRRIKGDEWTAFIGGDNYAVGKLMAQWVREKFIIKNSQSAMSSREVFEVLEVQGMQNSVPEQLRHQGFIEGLQSLFPNPGPMPVVHSVCGAQDAYSAVSEFLAGHPHLDAIVAQNDLMAIDAAKAVSNSQSTNHNSQLSIPVMGVDGIILGLQAIVDGDIECTAVYPTRGDLIIRTASQILHGEPFARDTVLETMLIDGSAAYPLLKQYEGRMRDLNTIRLMQLQSQKQRNETLEMKRLLLSVIVILSILFLAAILTVLLIQRSMQTKINQTILPQLEDVHEVLQISHRDAAFMENVQRIVDDHLTNPDLNVEYLSATLHLDRTQVYRRIKTITGKGPMEYIRERRLIRADELLQTTDKTIRQVALELGFASPGYFSKYYKQYFGHLPSERE